MLGRVNGVKKTFLLRFFAIFFSLAFVSLATLSFFVFKIPDLWFFSFCICLGLYEIIKSTFFKLDSAFYLGNLLFFIGLSGFIFLFTKTSIFSSVFILSSFTFASLLTFLCCGQRFHLIIAFSTTFIGFYSYLLIKNLITPVIFIAFIVAFLLLLLIGTIIEIKRRL